MKFLLHCINIYALLKTLDVWEGLKTSSRSQIFEETQRKQGEGQCVNGGRRRCQGPSLVQELSKRTRTLLAEENGTKDSSTPIPALLEGRVDWLSNHGRKGAGMVRECGLEDRVDRLGGSAPGRVGEIIADWWLETGGKSKEVRGRATRTLTFTWL